MIRGTKSEDVIKVLEMIQLSKRKTVKEVTLDLSPTMMRIVRSAFPNATMTYFIDREKMHLQNHSMPKLKLSEHNSGESEIFHPSFSDYVN